jgi:hypothetical protein
VMEWGKVFEWVFGGRGEGRCLWWCECFGVWRRRKRRVRKRMGVEEGGLGCCKGMGLSNRRRRW